MKFGIVSDFHLEFYNEKTHHKILIEKLNRANCDIILHAGDILSNRSVFAIDDWFGNIEKPVLYIKGNHDYYHHSFQNDLYKNDEYNLIAATLWTNFADSPIIAHEAQRAINDFRFINFVSPTAMTEFYNEAKDFIFSVENNNHHIVMTHFAPHLKSIATKYKGDVLNRYFVNDLDYEIFNSNKRLWVHGHTHTKFDYKIGNCRIVCNPLGYPGELFKYVEDYEVLILEENVDF